jgi:hypothetical protein
MAAVPERTAAISITAPALVDELYAVGRGLSVISGNELILDFLTFVQRADPGPLQRGNVNEHIFTAVGRLDESIAFAGVKPLYGTYTHSILHNVDRNLARPGSRVISEMVKYLIITD